MSINNIDIKDLLAKFTPSKNRRYLGWRIAYLTTLGLTMAGCIILSLFLYQNIFSTLNNAQNVILLSSELGMDNIDTAAFNKAEEHIKNRQTDTTQLTLDLRNIFEYPIISTSTEAVTKSTTTN